MIKNFKFSELIHTSSKLDNTPDDMNIVCNLCTTANQLQKIRDMFGKAIRVNSCYRSSAVNAAVGGSKTSAHVQGLAADIAAYSGKSADNTALWQLVTTKIDEFDIDQAICYTADGTLKTPIKWVHVGFRSDGVPRKQVIFKKG